MLSEKIMEHVHFKKWTLKQMEAYIDHKLITHKFLKSNLEHFANAVGALLCGVLWYERVRVIYDINLE